jgi:hypothetical protein
VMDANFAGGATRDPVAEAHLAVEELALIEDKLKYAVMLGIVARSCRIPKASLHPVVMARRREMAGVTTSVFDRDSDVEIAKWIAEQLRGQHGDVPFANAEFWRFDGTHWKSFTPDEMRRFVHTVDGAPLAGGGDVKLKKGRVDGILFELASILAQPHYFDKAPRGINCASGFIAFDTNGVPTQHQHSPDHRQRHVLPGKWKPGAKGNPPRRSLLHKLLTGCFKGDPDGDGKRSVLQEVAGAAAAGCATKLKEPKALVLYGERAENGKGQITGYTRVAAGIGDLQRVARRARQRPRPRRPGEQAAEHQRRAWYFARRRQ